MRCKVMVLLIMMVLTAFAQKKNELRIINNATKIWNGSAWITVGGSGSTDTTSLSNRINAKQNAIPNIADTAKYWEKADTNGAIVALNKLLNEYFSKDSTVSKIIAGSNITATKNGTSGAWTISASAGGSSDTLVRKREMQYLKNASAATGTAVGLPAAPTLSGSQLTADDTYGPFLKHSTNTTNNNFGGVTSAFTVVRGDWEPELHARVQMDTAANTTGVWWVGFFSAAPDSNGRPNYHMAAFRYHTLWDNTAFWRCVTIAGTGSTNQTTVTTVATAINTPYNFSIYPTSTAVRFFANGVLVATHSTVVPTATTLLGYVVRVANIGTTKHNIRWSRIAVYHK